MGCVIWWGIPLVAIVIIWIAQRIWDQDEKTKELRALSPEEFRERLDRAMWGPSNREMICPHCHTKGEIRTKSTEVKKGVSGGKATAAILTAGLSLFVTGLSRKEDATQAHCENCKNTWLF